MFGRNKRRQELLQEFAQDIELEVQEKLKAGMSPEEAEYAPERSSAIFNQLQKTRRPCAVAFGFESLRLDLKYGFPSRQGIARLQGALVCALTVGFAAVNHHAGHQEIYLEAPLPSPHCEELFQVYSEVGAAGYVCLALCLDLQGSRGAATQW